MREIRLRLEKTGRIKYVSHLDMFRIMQRAVRRADIPLWYTEGFNPHPYISFLLALSLGIEGLCEPVDIRIMNDMSCDEIKNKLNSVMPDGLRIVGASEPFNKPADIAFAEYEVFLSKSDISEEELYKALTSGNLTFEKSGKSGKKKIMKTVSVSENIKEFSINNNGEDISLVVILPAGSTFNINALQLLEAVKGNLQKEICPLRVIRTKLLTADMTEFI